LKECERIGHFLTQTPVIKDWFVSGQICCQTVRHRYAKPFVSAITGLGKSFALKQCFHCQTLGSVIEPVKPKRTREEVQTSSKRLALTFQVSTEA
jgi:hypothetical protein